MRTSFKRSGLQRANLARRAFTLLEVMIAVGILFMCLFAVLALLSNSLATARKLQQHRTVDIGTIDGMIYVKIANTNDVREGSSELDIEELYPGYHCHYENKEIASNHLCQVNVEVDHNQRLELETHFLMYEPNLKTGGIGKDLPQH
jgi:hypothetical protein